MKNRGWLHRIGLALLIPRLAMRAGLRKRHGPGATAIALSMLTVLSGLALPSAAHAATTVYEIEGQWSAATPNPVTTGAGITALWRYNINDADAAPDNTAKENVTVTFSAQGAIFTDIPDVCLTEGVNPVSEIQDNGEALVCNLGTRDHGTAELVLTGVRSTGITGKKISMSATIGESGGNQVSASLPELDIANTFAMDVKFNGGSPRSVPTNGAPQHISFPWSLRHSPGSTAGPNSVSFDLPFSATGGEIITPQMAGCSAQDTTNSTHPHSGPGFPAEQTAPFPGTCTLAQVSPNLLRLTISGIDYSKAIVPALDSTGTHLPTDWDVVAAGLFHVQFDYDGSTTIAFTASAPTYTSSLGETFTDDPLNNSNSRVAARGVWTGGWQLNRQDPPLPGTIWTDTFRTMAGQPALAVSAVRPAQGAESASIICTILDTKYVTFESSMMGTIADGLVTPFPGISYEYFTGTGIGGLVGPSNPNYNPNDFDCEGTNGGTAWSTSLPADLSTVKAIRATIPTGAAIPSDIANMYTYTQVKPDVAVGQDIWTWTSYRLAGTWRSPTRSDNPADKTASGTLTPGTRYAYTGGGRDILRIVAGQPRIDKSVDQKVTMPGATVNFTLSYRVDAPVNTTVNGLELADVLPAGLTYVPSSASVTPTSVAGQTINWALDGVSTNTDYTILLSATVTSDATAGQQFSNSATVELAGVSRSDTAVTRVRDGGYTFVTKTADAQKVPHVNGVAEDGWRVRLTSADSGAQTYTDTVDILPYNGDGRGTSFSGSYQLSGPVTAVAGATVYYTASDPATLVDDPADPSNGAAGDPTGNTVGWTTIYNPAATAVRVIGPRLDPGASQEFKINVVTTGANFEDMYVNRAEARTSRTQLVMRTSDWFQIGAVNSVALKKYVQDKDGGWRDAQDIDDYPEFLNGDTATYRIVVTNTGDETLFDLELSDDKVDLTEIDLEELDIFWGVITELLPGAENAISFEYDAVITGVAGGDMLVNTACVVPFDAGGTPPGGGHHPPPFGFGTLADHESEPFEESCDPAGLTVSEASLAWEKVAAGTVENLAGSEWELVMVDANQNPTGTPINVTDCDAVDAVECTAADQDPATGKFRIDELPDGTYRLTETRAPAGFILDSDPRYITVQGMTELPLPITNEQTTVPEIPLTGGIGASWIFLGGGVAAGIALVLLVRRQIRGTAMQRPLTTNS